MIGNLAVRRNWALRREWPLWQRTILRKVRELSVQDEIYNRAKRDLHRVELTTMLNNKTLDVTVCDCDSDMEENLLSCSKTSKCLLGFIASTTSVISDVRKFECRACESTNHRSSLEFFFLRILLEFHFNRVLQCLKNAIDTSHRIGIYCSLLLPAYVQRWYIFLVKSIYCSARS